MSPSCREYSYLQVPDYPSNKLYSQYKRTSVHAEGVAPVQVDETTPIIRCMLEYLQLDQLNVRADVLKMFYALVHWGFGISNKSDFISGCISQLVSA